MIKQKFCMLLITYKQISVHDSFLTSRMNHFILIMAQSRDTIERKDLCVLVVPRNHSFRSHKPSFNLRESYSSRDARKRRILSHIGIVRTWAENGQAGSEEPSRAILQCNYLSPTIFLSFPQVSSFVTFPGALKFNEPCERIVFLFVRIFPCYSHCMNRLRKSKKSHVNFI